MVDFFFFCGGVGGFRGGRGGAVEDNCKAIYLYYQKHGKNKYMLYTSCEPLAHC